MHMAQASSGCAYLKHENALVIWNTDISLLALRVPMVHAALSAEKGFASVIDANVAAVKNGGGCTSVAGTSAALEQSRQRSRRRRLLGTASSLLAAACACFIVMGVTVRHLAGYVDLLCVSHQCCDLLCCPCSGWA